MRPGVIHIHELEMVSTDGYSLDDVPKLREKVREIMQNAYLELTGQ